MARMFYEVAEAAAALGISTGELEEMFSLGELSQVAVGTSRRLVRIRDVEAVLERVRSGGRLRTRREFRASSVAGAIEKAAAFLGIAPKHVSYKLLERGNIQAPGAAAREARIAVDLPEGAPVELAGREAPEEEAPSPVGEAPRTVGSGYYAPEQAARLMGVSSHEVNLRIYRKDLPTVDINGYRWIPMEALDELLNGLSRPELADPPRPFLMLTVPTPEGEAACLATHEIKGMPPVEDLLKGRLGELEEQIEALKHELRLEKARRIGEPRADLVG